MRGLMKRQESGFTIIELMIATSILSIILVMVTAMMIGIGNLFYKGVNQARVQDSARSITEDVSHNLQLTNQTPLSSVATTIGGVQIQTWCLGSTGYSYVIGRKINSSSQPKHVLWRNTQAIVGTCRPADLSSASPDHINGGTNGTELIPPNSRLRNFTIGTVSPYAITVGIVYGDDDLICSPLAAGSCTATTAMSPASKYRNGDLRCKGKTGDQFCSVSVLTTTVVQRIN